jgi:hypothetical protein
MRTTLDIDEDVLAAARELARRQRISTGKMVSRLLHRGLTGQGRYLPAIGDVASTTPPTAGFRPFPAQRVVTNDEVNELREAEGV